MKLSFRRLGIIVAMLSFSVMAGLQLKSDPVFAAETTALPKSADVIVYGGTSAGVMAAVQAHRLGKSVILIEPGTHLGGLTSGGLGWTDSGNKAVIGGISREFYQRVKKVYDHPESWKWQTPEECKRYRENEDAIWVFEPHVAEQVFEDYVTENKIPVYRNERLDLDHGVVKRDNEIVEIQMESGLKIHGKRFIDATYEGDLMAKAGVTYTVGREANSVYGETLNGVQKAKAVSHQFKKPVSAFLVSGDSSSGVLPGAHLGDPGEDGAGDHRVQAYCFRMCLTNLPENRVPFPKPDNYDPLRYEILARYLEAGWSDVFGKFDPIPNRKTDTNNRGAFSTDNIGMNYEYPDGDYETRARIFQEHLDYQQGFFWFLANDPRVPEKIQAQMNNWGLARDEFLDHGHWPHQLYIREARRMVSDFVMTENHLRRMITTPAPIGMGSYNMDSHNVQRYVTEDGFVRNEGDLQIHLGSPYPIGYQAILPKQDECANLLVPVCLSSSHIAYGSIRMEPVFMVLGQSAATAACQSIDNNQPVQQVDYNILKNQLLEDGQVLEYSGSTRSTRTGINPKSLKGIVIDDSQAIQTGDWALGNTVENFVGPGYLHDSNKNLIEKSIAFEFKVPADGSYDVRLSYTPHGNRASNVPVTVEHLDGATTKSINQQTKPTIRDTFVSLGTFNFLKNTPGRVIIRNTQANGFVVADSVWIVPAVEAHSKD